MQWSELKPVDLGLIPIPIAIAIPIPIPIPIPIQTLLLSHICKMCTCRGRSEELIMLFSMLVYRSFNNRFPRPFPFFDL